MSEHKVAIHWQNREASTHDGKPSFVHQWTFDGGITVDASPSPFVMSERSKEEAIDPEEAFIAAIASCHMMTFLTVAEKQRFSVESYADEAIGTLGKLENGRTAVTDVVLKPTITFSGDNQPSPELLAKMHQLAHKHCFIANSVTTNITVESD
ncbi:OsmC family protein [Grimontia sp. S25]|uniref:OsmC family protein n=1 Tax=Grimontia sedimenti TaxID=2711294 RepID=A0A6M1RI70_9GAMM|nr:OsmC family protein [Grimontia sedimenti]NGN97269.1 OsmC family protein [Grimontia sedimenti]